jgi:hypothetical protein
MTSRIHIRSSNCSFTEEKKKKKKKKKAAAAAAHHDWLYNSREKE